MKLEFFEKMLSKFVKSVKSEKGFTLIEALAATVISGIGITGFTTLMGLANASIYLDVRSNVALGFAIDTMEFVKYVVEASEATQGKIELTENQEVQFLFNGGSRTKIAEINGEEIEYEVFLRRIPLTGEPDRINLSSRIARGASNNVLTSRFPVEVHVQTNLEISGGSEAKPLYYLVESEDRDVALYADYFTQRK